MATTYRAQRARASLSESVLWVVVDDAYEVHRVATDFCLALDGANRAANTVRAYAPKVAKFLTWCSLNGLDWTALSFADLTRYKRFIEREPMADGRPRSGRTTNLYLIVLCEFLRFASREGLVDRALADRLSEPKFLRYLPRGFDPGEDGQRRLVQARTLKVCEYEKSPESLEPDEIAAVLRACQNPRDLFLARVMLDMGLRIGEVLGLRRSDIHFLPDSSMLGCSTPGPHLHVYRRQNTNGSTAKSRYPRSVPASTAVVDAYREYWDVRQDVVPDSVSDFVFVNLYGAEPDTPMAYSNAKRCMDRIAKTAGVTLRPHMLRHTAATTWLRNGERIDVVQELLGHASPASTQVYLHPSEEEKRAAVDRLALGKELS